MVLGSSLAGRNDCVCCSLPMTTAKRATGSRRGATEPDFSQDIMSGIGGESEEDLIDLNPALVAQAVVFATDWTADTIIGQLRKGNISLDPSFQRRDAWTVQRKSKFVESIILGLPIPQLVLAENLDHKGTFIVIDGKQRLLSLQQFAGINLEDGIEPLKLNGLEIVEDLNGATYQDLSSDSRRHSQFAAFENQSIRTVIVRNWQKEAVLYLIFHRLNTGSVPLSPQELRQALHPGGFLKFVARYSETSTAVQRVLGLDKPDFRMRDVELLVRYFAFRNRIGVYAGNLKKFLDDTCNEFNKDWRARSAELQKQAKDFDSAVETAFVIFGENAFRKYDGSTYERRFNRAVFDVITYYFALEAVRKKAAGNKLKVRSAFEQLCTKNADFRRAIETTTKSREATTTRFRQWGAVLKKATGASFEIASIGK
jgi:hypothetical protein